MAVGSIATECLPINVTVFGVCVCLVQLNDPQQ